MKPSSSSSSAAVAKRSLLFGIVGDQSSPSQVSLRYFSGLSLSGYYYAKVVSRRQQRSEIGVYRSNWNVRMTRQNMTYVVIILARFMYPSDLTACPSFVAKNVMELGWKFH